ncbi:hypothetical protein B0H19DRAFT_682294 [Mycena capillaripes]|nr:hypothetical protein B0H19DRAFT_682294 [Mycena capillaripes]
MSTFGLFLPSWSRVVDGVSAPAVSAPIHLHLHQNDRLTFGTLFEIDLVLSLSQFVSCAVVIFKNSMFHGSMLKGKEIEGIGSPRGIFSRYTVRLQWSKVPLMLTLNLPPEIAILRRFLSPRHTHVLAHAPCAHARCCLCDRRSICQADYSPGVPELLPAVVTCLECGRLCRLRGSAVPGRCWRLRARGMARRTSFVVVPAVPSAM